VTTAECGWSCHDVSKIEVIVALAEAVVACAHAAILGVFFSTKKGPKRRPHIPEKLRRRHMKNRPAQDQAAHTQAQTSLEPTLDQLQQSSLHRVILHTTHLTAKQHTLLSQTLRTNPFRHPELRPTSLQPATAAASSQHSRPHNATGVLPAHSGHTCCTLRSPRTPGLNAHPSKHKIPALRREAAKAQRRNSKRPAHGAQHGNHFTSGSWRRRRRCQR
jgi:hypothetical protein